MSKQNLPKVLQQRVEQVDKEIQSAIKLARRYHSDTHKAFADMIKGYTDELYNAVEAKDPMAIVLASTQMKAFQSFMVAQRNISISAVIAKGLPRYGSKELMFCPQMQMIAAIVIAFQTHIDVVEHNTLIESDEVNKLVKKTIK